MISVTEFNTWIRPLIIEDAVEGALLVSAPNKFIRNWIMTKYQSMIEDVIVQKSDGIFSRLEIVMNDARPAFSTSTVAPSVPAQPLTTVAALSGVSYAPQASGYHIQSVNQPVAETAPVMNHNKPLVAKRSTKKPASSWQHDSSLNSEYTFDSFVQGKSNQLALAAALQVAENKKNRGNHNNPLFIYGGVGLGKTHLMHAIGNELLRKNPEAKVLYLNSERFVQDMVKSLRHKAMPEFQRFYRNLDALFIDDIQFFAGKDQSQEEFFHTFNALLDNGQTIIMTSDRFPKAIENLEERLKSRFGWGLAIAVEPPELETRVAILMKKAESFGYPLSSDAAFFIAEKIRSNVRDLEGALRRVCASADFQGSPITIPLIKESLKDLISLQDKLISIDNIQRLVAEYYKIKVSDLLSKSRKQSVTRPRHVAMALSRELTNHSLPEIGAAFGGRDHSTVLNACSRVKELQVKNVDIQEDYKLLLRSLTS